VKPNPAIQSRQAHRRRKALGRALHQIDYIRNLIRRRARRGPVPAVRFAIPKLLRKHKLRLARAFFRA
jgi:hypothetical protein